MKGFSIGDIVFVENYVYKNGEKGTEHMFVIVDEGQVIQLSNYFGFLVSSNMSKASYPFNEVLNKDNANNLKMDSIVKCDDLIEIAEDEIKFKVGNVMQDDLLRFIDTYFKYLNE